MNFCYLSMFMFNRYLPAVKELNYEYFFFLFADALVMHMQSRLGDLYVENSMIPKFRALDFTLWPKMDDSRESKEAFIMHGKDEIETLCVHYEKLLAEHNTTCEEVLAEYRLYKTHARNRKGTLRQTLLEILQRGGSI